jgi:hypothetical protein
MGPAQKAWKKVGAIREKFGDDWFVSEVQNDLDACKMDVAANQMAFPEWDVEFPVLRYSEVIIAEGKVLEEVEG